MVELRGRITDQNGVTALGAKGKVLVTDQLERPAALAQEALPPIALAPAMTSSSWVWQTCCSKRCLVVSSPQDCFAIMPCGADGRCHRGGVVAEAKLHNAASLWH